MNKVIAETAEDLQHMMDTTNELSDEAVLDRIRQCERLAWAGDHIQGERLSRLHRYSVALREEALKRMRLWKI
jgi:hypothetical protein